MKNTLRFLSFVVTLVIFVGCASSSRQASNFWDAELRNAKFTSFQPPRSGLDLGDIISFDSSGREVLISKLSTCVQGITFLPPESSNLLSTSVIRNLDSGIGAEISELLSGKIDIKFLVEYDREYEANISFNNPRLHRFEKIKLDIALSELDRNSPCYKAITSPENFVIVQVIEVEGANFEMKNKDNSSLVFTADILNQAHAKPEIVDNSNSLSIIQINVPMQIGYRAIQVKELAGLIEDSVLTRELDFTKLEQLREHAKKSL